MKKHYGKFFAILFIFILVFNLVMYATHKVSDFTFWSVLVIVGVGSWVLKKKNFFAQ